ncbi:MAG: DUF3179 domain-containing protein [Candidatus Krumholzibacteriota bacterium]|nr:DUF3179 domain-containing protein [Candidatus Krumholzibacteriota bacterium]
MKGDYRGRGRTGQTYNGLLKALERQKDTVLPIVKTELRTQARRRFDHLRGNDPWVLLAVDGSKENLPRTHDHESVFGIADNGFTPQAFITTIVEVHTGLLWDWRLGRARASEKRHLMEMIPDIPDDAWILGVLINGEARAYDLNLLNHHEIVNDEVGGTPVAAVW